MFQIATEQRTTSRLPETMWDYLILTASSPAQAAAYEEQLALRRKLELLESISHTLVVADPGARRIGSGGSTLCCLAAVLQRELGSAWSGSGESQWQEALAGLRILIMHAGGDARRLPAYGPTGKIFIPLPDRETAAPGTTLFDRQLPTYLGLPENEDRGQVIITAGDVLLEFDPAAVHFAPSGMTGVACYASPHQASGHGVFCPAPDGSVRRFLQKPTAAAQRRADALNDQGQAALDIGIFHFDAGTAARLLGICDWQTGTDRAAAWSGAIGAAIDEHGLDFYRELCCVLGRETTLTDYLQTVQGAGSRWIVSALESFYTRAAPLPLSVHVLPRCEFLHFGTSRQIISSGRQLQRRDRGYAAAQRCLSMNNHLGEAVELPAVEAWVEGCRIEAELQLDAHSALIGADVREPLSLPAEACLDLLPGRSPAGAEITFVRCYRQSDSLAEAAGEASVWCGQPLSEWMAEAGLADDDIWPENLPREARSLWNARLHPAEADAAAFTRWLWLLSPAGATADQLGAWRTADRFSFSEMNGLTRRDAFHQRRAHLREPALLLKVPRLLAPESDFSAAALAHLLECSANRTAWLAAVVGAARERIDNRGQSGPSLAFVAARMLHTLGTASNLAVGDGHSGSLGELFPKANEWLSPADRRVLASQGLATGGVLETAEPVKQWSKNLQQAAFSLLERAIFQSGRTRNAPPRSVLRSDEIVWGRAPARLDLAGGWTDTPPYALEHGGCVLNVAVDLNGQPPIQAYARLTSEPVIRLHSIDRGSDLVIRALDELTDYRECDQEFALVKAALSLAGFAPESADWPHGITLPEILAHFGGGLQITTLAAVPKGSGLGTSSILGGVVLAVIHRMQGEELAADALFHEVLRLEQALTTGGGWQDQVGGMTGGLKLVTTAPGLVPQADIRYLPHESIDPTRNGGQTLLYYTGITRLAKNILQQVVGRYLNREAAALATLRKIHALPEETATAIARRDIARVGGLVDAAWSLNKRLDPNSTTSEIENLLHRAEPYLHGAKLLGAGGGGFLLMVCKSPADARTLRDDLEESPPNPRARFFEFSVNQRGLVTTVC